MKKIYKRSCGFSLLEVLFALSIMTILASVAVPYYADYEKKARIGLVMEYMSGLISGYTADLIDSGEVDFSGPLREPMEYLQCVSIEVYRDNQGECNDVHLIAWPSADFDDGVKLGRTRMLIFNGKLDTQTNRVNWQCGPYRNTRLNIANTLLPVSCQNAAQKPEGRICLTGRQKRENTRCARNK